MPEIKTTTPPCFCARVAWWTSSTEAQIHVLSQVRWVYFAKFDHSSLSYTPLMKDIIQYKMCVLWGNITLTLRAKKVSFSNLIYHKVRCIRMCLIQSSSWHSLISHNLCRFALINQSSMSQFCDLLQVKSVTIRWDVWVKAFSVLG